MFNIHLFICNKCIRECVNHMDVPKSMSVQHVCILSLCPPHPLSLGQHVQRLQSGLSAQHKTLSETLVYRNIIKWLVET